MHPQNKGERKRIRFFKGMRRLKQDLNEHATYTTAYGGIPNQSCPCQAENSRQGKGKTFARFADYAAHCSCDMCSRQFDVLPSEARAASFERDQRALAEEFGLGERLT